MDAQERNAVDYEQTAAYFKELHETRFRLLALLPIAAGAAIALLPARIGQDQQIALGALGFLVTVGLTIYDQRNTQIYDRIVRRGHLLERLLGFQPLQIPLVDDRRPVGGAFSDRPKRGTLLGFKVIWHDLGLSLVYAASLMGWAYVLIDGLVSARPLRFGLPAVVAAVAFVILLRLAHRNDLESDEINKWIDTLPIGTGSTKHQGSHE